MTRSNPPLTDDFSTDPFWWEAWRPQGSLPPDGLQSRVDVLIVGGGYTGVSCALTLAQAGVDCLVLDAGPLGHGASTRSGGQITGGVNIGKAPGAGKRFGAPAMQARRQAMLTEAAEAMGFLESLIEKFRIDCGYHRTGRLTAFWTPAHYKEWEVKLDELNRLTGARAFMVRPREMADEIGSSFYSGGAVIGRAGHLNPAALYGGLLAAAQRAGATLCGSTPVTSITRHASGFSVATTRGQVDAAHVVLATNGHPSSVSPRLHRSVVPITSHMIATEPLPEGLASSLIPKNRAVSETRRVTNHYRLSPDGRRLVFGGRARFVPTSPRKTATLLYDAVLRRFPQMQGHKITHSWEGNVAMTFDFLPHIGRSDDLHFALGCNGSGVVMMTYLGHRVARTILAKGEEAPSAFDTGEMPTSILYRGTPWFLSGIGTIYQMLDGYDHWRGAPRGRASKNAA